MRICIVYTDDVDVSQSFPFQLINVGIGVGVGVGAGVSAGISVGVGAWRSVLRGGVGRLTALSVVVSSSAREQVKASVTTTQRPPARRPG